MSSGNSTFSEYDTTEEIQTEIDPFVSDALQIAIEKAIENRKSKDLQNMKKKQTKQD
jgi:hypothetical protein